MPVLDARALKDDPKGAAFLRDVLRPCKASKAPVAESRSHKASRPHKASHLHKASKRSEERVAALRQRLAALQGTAS